MNKIATKIAIGIIGACMASTAPAHHSFAMFDKTKLVPIEGTVTDFQWANPHIWVVMKVKGANGKMQEWRIEGHSPSTLRQRGWTRNDMKAGDKVKLFINPLRTGKPGGSLVSAQLANGTLRDSEMKRTGGKE